MIDLMNKILKQTIIELDNKIVIMFILFLPLLLTITGCGRSDKDDEKVVFTQINQLLTEKNHDCKQFVIDVGNDLIGDKTHYLQIVNIPAAASLGLNEEKEESSTNMAENLKGSNKNNLIISGLLEYNDRPSHVRFDAFLVDEPIGQKSCVVSYQLDYHFDDPCIAIREEAFKKWNKLGDLGNKTQYYVHKRHPNKKVFLTNLSRNTQCLASVREIQNFVTYP